MSYELVRLVELVLMPPGHSVLLWLIGLVLLLRGRPVGAAACGVIGALSIVGFSTPLVAGALMRTLEPASVLTVDDLAGRQPGAIVVLAGGRRSWAPEYGAGNDVEPGRAHSPLDTVSDFSLTRLRYGAALHRRTGLPLLVSGGQVRSEGTAEAELIAAVLQDEFSVPVKWLETESRNTAENAIRSRDILASAGIEEIVLVTSALHMPRSVAAFEAVGVQVIAAPTAYMSKPQAGTRWMDWLPSAGALAGSAQALHEWLGMAWYRLRYF